MINLSSIKLHMYCPMKLYLKNHLDEEENRDYLLHNEVKNLRIDIQDLIQKNLRKITKTMKLLEIEEILTNNIPEYLENSITNLRNSNYKISNEQLEEINNEIYFNLKILSLKAQKAMQTLEKDGIAIVEMFFPSTIYSYLIKDSQLDISGTCDKIKIINGNYYPISIKSSNPPLKGVWDSDAIELVANALLIEEEFDTEVFVGFIDYLKIGDRRPVVMNVELRKGLFNVLNEIKEITNNKKIPKVNINKNKCLSCEYEAICINNED